MRRVRSTAQHACAAWLRSHLRTRGTHDPLCMRAPMQALYNKLYFHDKLGACVVEWSEKKMTR